MEDPTEAPPQALGVNPAIPSMTGFDSLPTLDRVWWLRRCEPVAANLARLFSPRRCDLAYAGPYRARLTITADDGNALDCGEVALEEPS